MPVVSILHIYVDGSYRDQMFASLEKKTLSILYHIPLLTEACEAVYITK